MNVAQRRFARRKLRFAPLGVFALLVSDLLATRTVPQINMHAICIAIFVTSAVRIAYQLLLLDNGDGA